MQLSISHHTYYQFDGPVDYGLQQLRLTPKAGRNQQLLGWKIAVEGGSVEAEFDDQHNNLVSLIRLAAHQGRAEIMVEGLVETSGNDGVVGPHRGFVPLWMFKRDTKLTKPGPNIRALIRALDDKGDSDLAKAHRLSALILEQVRYEIGRTDASFTAEQALAAEAGVCQDHSHIFITTMRAMGFPARYVSGYLMLNDRVEQDATHAWAEAYFDNIGWVGFDISNGQSPDERYVRLATGLDYRDARPVSGMRFGDATEDLHVQVQVQQ